MTGGAIALVGLTAWSLIAVRASADARRALEGDAQVRVEHGDRLWRFTPVGRPSSRAGLVFYPGALVDPVAYAPTASAVARAGYPVVLIELPTRGAFGGADSPEIFPRAREAMRLTPGVSRWAVSGHSRGGAVAARMAFADPAGLSGLVLIGTSHPRDFSLAQTPLRVTRVYGTHDTVASVSKQETTRRNLPESARIVVVEGGNHSQFGSYGFQPGDWPATVSRAEQQRQTVAALIEMLESVSRSD